MIQPVRVSFVHNYHSPLEFNTVRYFFKTLIQPVRVSFVHNYRTVLLNLPDGTTLHFHLQGDRTGFVLHTVRYFCETSFSPYGFHLYTNISSIPQSFGIQYRTVLLQNLDSARTGFICTQLPYGTTLHFHVQGEGVSLPLARSHAFSLGHRCSHVLPQSHHFQTVSTMSTSCMSTFECPKVIPYGLDLSLVPCRFLLHRTGFLSVIPYGLSVRTCGSHLAIPYGATLSTVRDNFSFFDTGWSKVNRTVFPFSSTVRYFPTDVDVHTVRFMADNRTGLVFQIPYGISIATWKTYIAAYRTGLVFEPYGITFTEPYGTWISNTVRYFNCDVGNLHRYIPYGTLIRTVRYHFHSSTSNDTSPSSRTGYQFTPYGMFFFRLPHHVLVNFSAVLQHEIVLTFKYVTLVTLCFSSDFPALALSPPVQTHTVRDFQPNFYHRTVFLFLFFSYRTG